MLIGRFDNSIDAKGRMIIPAKFRNDLDGKCVLTYGLDGCLYLYPAQKWESFVEKLMTLPQADENVRLFSRYFFANAVECDIDKQGRITIPPQAREFAQIEKELVTIGFAEKAEIWGKEVFNAEKEPKSMDAKALAAHIAIYEKI
jgi:MraZ protein